MLCMLSAADDAFWDDATQPMGRGISSSPRRGLPKTKSWLGWGEEAWIDQLRMMILISPADQGQGESP